MSKKIIILLFNSSDIYTNIRIFFECLLRFYNRTEQLLDWITSEKYIWKKYVRGSVLYWRGLYYEFECPQHENVSHRFLWNYIPTGFDKEMLAGDRIECDMESSIKPEGS